MEAWNPCQRSKTLLIRKHKPIGMEEKSPCRFFKEFIRHHKFIKQKLSSFKSFQSVCTQHEQLHLSVDCGRSDGDEEMWEDLYHETEKAQASVTLFLGMAIRVCRAFLLLFKLRPARPSILPLFSQGAQPSEKGEKKSFSRGNKCNLLNPPTS